MGQGYAMACLAAAYTVTGDPAYLAAGRRAFVALRAPFGDDGTAVRVGEGVFYEEVAGAGARPAHILNGMIFALAGIWMLDAVDPHARYEQALREGIAGVRSLLDSYIAPGTSLYDLGLRRPAPLGKYNVVHVEQLQWLYELTGDPHFLEVALGFMASERRLQSSFAVSGAPSVSANGRFHGRRNEMVTLRASFSRATPIDRVGLIASDGHVPAEVLVDTGGRRVRVRPQGRNISIDVPLRSTRSVDIRLSPRRGSRVAVLLVTLSNPAMRSFTVLSSDIDSYRDTRSGSRTPLNLTDRRIATRWSSSRADPWLLISLGEAKAHRIRLTTCLGTAPFTWSFSPDLTSFTQAGRASGSATARVVDLIPLEGARYVLVQWRGTGGCLAEISP